MTPSLRLASRASPLALAQLDLVRAALAELALVEVVPVRTAGDARRDVPIHAIGGRGVFTKEVDEAVVEGRADAAVHSAKDLPSGLAPGLVIGAFLPRADPRDVLVGTPLAGLRAGATVATGSVRRRAQLAWLRPDLRFAELRGNLETRLAKVPAGGAVVTAAAALDRLGLSGRAAQVFTPKEMLPQVGQGAIAVCCRADDDTTRALLRAVDHGPTRLEVECERAWLAAVGGGCDAPVGALAVWRPAAGLELEAMIASGDGHVLVRRGATGEEPSELGARVAAGLLEGGGRMLLEGERLGP